jgi:hypothetical protein
MLWMFSLIKVRITKNPALRKKDKRLELMLIKHDEFLKRVEGNRRSNNPRVGNNDTLVDSRDLDLAPNDNPQIEFMREVLYNYLDKDLKQDRIDM